MNFIQIKNFINAIEVKFTDGGYIYFKYKDSATYNKKTFFGVESAYLFATTRFIYNRNIVNGIPEFTFNSIIIITFEGTTKTFQTFELFITYVEGLDYVESIIAN